METLQDFYTRIEEARDVRAEAVRQYLRRGFLDPEAQACLRALRAALCALPTRNGLSLLRLEGGMVGVELSYELGEIEKDLVFLSRGPEALIAYLGGLHEDFAAEVQRLVDALRHVQFHNFVTDRDGTINNYCGRYRSSIQSIYNAVFLARFIEHSTRHATIVTSGPLKDPGVVSVSVMPDGVVNFAASKAREFLDVHGREGRYPIAPEQAGVLDRFNARVAELTRDPQYLRFTLIGSGVQFKFGETTLARQDKAGSIPVADSRAWLERIREICLELDPSESMLGVVDMDLDVEVILKQASDAEFSKADGLRFVNEALPLNLDRGSTLVCGDTSGDLPLLEACLDLSADVRSVFVTRDFGLAQQARQLCPTVQIVSEVDALVTALYSAI